MKLSEINGKLIRKLIRMKKLMNKWKIQEKILYGKLQWKIERKS